MLGRRPGLSWHNRTQGAIRRVTVQAVQHVRRMRGGAQSHLMRCEDGNFYVVKFQNNPQHLRVLANEMLATRLAERIGLPVPAAALIEVSAWLVEKTPELKVQLGGGERPCQPGLQFGARFVIDPLEGQVFDYLPEEMLERVKNLRDFHGMLCLDKWTGNTNGRQAVFSRKGRERRYTATFIDQGYCFNAGEWDFPDSPLRGVYARNEVYRGVKGWGDFEPWLSAIEGMRRSEIDDVAAELPPEWCGDWDALSGLTAKLYERRERVRELVEAFRKSTRKPFPEWEEETSLQHSAASIQP